MTKEEFDSLCRQRADVYIPACGGTETPFTSRSGKRLLYVFHPASGNHGYINVDTDMLLTADEVMEALQLT